MIPGSSVKGIGRSQSGCIQNKEVVEYLFGNDWGERDESAVISGGIAYHDAWWVPDGDPFVSEIVTVHHADYYTSMGDKEATDFDSPVPVPQIATSGKFYFVIEGPQAWAELARHLIQQALLNNGIGGKRSSGYGYLKVLMT
jgi:CRISPR type III-B/RAMP module RAMP protein Cmr6